MEATSGPSALPTNPGDRDAADRAPDVHRTGVPGSLAARGHRARARRVGVHRPQRAQVSSPPAAAEASAPRQVIPRSACRRTAAAQPACACGRRQRLGSADRRAQPPRPLDVNRSCTAQARESSAASARPLSPMIPVRTHRRFASHMSSHSLEDEGLTARLWRRSRGLSV